MSSSRARPIPLRTAVRSMIDGDVFVAAAGVTPHVFGDTITVTPSNRPRSSMSIRLPSAITAVLAAFHDTPRASATRATVTCWRTRASSAQRPAGTAWLAAGRLTAVLTPHREEPASKPAFYLHAIYAPVLGWLVSAGWVTYLIQTIYTRSQSPPLA